MSTILKALRRLEEDKSRAVTSRPLREEVASGPRETQRRRLPWLPVAAMIVGAGLGASAWYVWPYERGGEPVREAKGETGAPAPSAVAQAPGAAAPAPPPDTPVTRRLPPGFHAGATRIEGQLAQLADTGPEPGAPPEDAFSSNVEVVQRPMPTPRLEPTPQGERPPDRVIPDPPGVAVEPPAVVARRSKPPTPTAPAPERVAAASGAVLPQSQAATPETQAAAPQPPVQTKPNVEPKRQVESKPQAQPKPAAPAPRVAKTTAPAAISKSSAAAASEVHVKRTQWHPEPARRSADLDVSGKSQSVHEGDVVDEYVVSEIRPSGVVLTRDGERVERSIGK
ncbi:MAG TPA: hypothetical protein VMS55_17665 [Myxococcota bacterium]|nr:hypothetical protein [Myxococcota bacterium]